MKCCSARHRVGSLSDPQEHDQLEGQTYAEKRCLQSRFERSFHVFMEQIAEN
jgi:hypothetical protein